MQDICVYCGVSGRMTRDHVFPKNLFPKTKLSGVQRLTVAACLTCNNSYSDDEAHFRNVVVLAGETNAQASALYNDKVTRSFYEKDGQKRLMDVMALTKPVVLDGQDRLRIYPADDMRILRVIKKCVRGLAHLHQVHELLSEDRVWADVLRYSLPEEMAAKLTFLGAEPEVVEYAYLKKAVEGIESIWLIRFFGRTTFIASISSELLHPANSHLNGD